MTGNDRSAVSFSPLRALTATAVSRVIRGRECNFLPSTVICGAAQRSCQTHIKINDESVSKAATSLHYCHTVNGPALKCCHGDGQMAAPLQQMEVKKLFGSSGGGAILAMGGSGSRCLSTSFGASAAI